MRWYFFKEISSQFQHTATEHQSGIKIERPHSKPKILEELISILRKILDFCVSCVTCGCCNRSAAEKVLSDEYGMILLDNEKRAVENLILYLNKGRENVHTVTANKSSFDMKGFIVIFYSIYVLNTDKMIKRLLTLGSIKCFIWKQI